MEQHQKKLNISSSCPSIGSLQFDKQSLLLDYNFILSICETILYKSRHISASKMMDYQLLNIYLAILQKQKSYLIDKDTLNFNKPFLLQFFIN